MKILPLWTTKLSLSSLNFIIDKIKFEITEDQNPVDGNWLRGLPSVPEDYDLWLRGRGGEDDKIVNPEDKVIIEEGYHFYTSKKTVTPGE